MNNNLPEKPKFNTLEASRLGAMPGARLSAQECREALGDAGGALSERELEQLRDQLYALAEIVFQNWSSETMHRRSSLQAPETE